MTLAQVYAVLAFYLAHRPEVDAYVAERAAISAARAVHEARFDPVGLRARLLARVPVTEGKGSISPVEVILQTGGAHAPPVL